MDRIIYQKSRIHLQPNKDIRRSKGKKTSYINKDKDKRGEGKIGGSGFFD